MELITEIEEDFFPVQEFRPLRAYFAGMDYNFCKSFLFAINAETNHIVHLALGLQTAQSTAIIGSVCWTERGQAHGFSFQISKVPRRIRINIQNLSNPMIDAETVTRRLVMDVLQDIHDKFIDKILRDKNGGGPRPHPSLFAIRRTRDNQHRRNFDNAINNHRFTTSFVDMCRRLKIQYT